MSTITKSNITIQYNGEGNETLSVYADINEGLDKSAKFTIKTKDQTNSVNVTVYQSGRREIFVNDFILADGSTFNVLKQ